MNHRSVYLKKRKVDSNVNETEKKVKVEKSDEIELVSKDYESDSDAETEIISDNEEYGSEYLGGLPPICHCISCFEYMGEMNPRQYCCKTHCPYESFEPVELFLIRVASLKSSPKRFANGYKDKIRKMIEAGDKICKDFKEN
jgi:hypothetical protein